jgi:hypothetical protein
LVSFFIGILVSEFRVKEPVLDLFLPSSTYRLTLVGIGRGNGIADGGLQLEWVISKQAKLRALSLLACNFGHLKLASLACLIEIVQLTYLLNRLINFI